MAGLLRCRPNAIWHAAVVNRGDIKPTGARHRLDNDSTAMPLPYKRFTTMYTLADFKEMLHNTPQGQHTMGMVHPSSMHNLLLRYWPPVLILTGTFPKTIPQRKWWWICKPEALMVTVWGTLEPPGRN